MTYFDKVNRIKIDYICLDGYRDKLEWQGVNLNNASSSQRAC